MDGFSQDVPHDLLSSLFAHWIKANDIFEDMLKFDHAFHCFKIRMFFFSTKIIDYCYGNPILIECIKMIIQDMCIMMHSFLILKMRSQVF